MYKLCILTNVHVYNQYMHREIRHIYHARQFPNHVNKLLIFGHSQVTKKASDKSCFSRLLAL